MWQPVVLLWVNEVFAGRTELWGPSWLKTAAGLKWSWSWRRGRRRERRTNIADENCNGRSLVPCWNFSMCATDTYNDNYMFQIYRLWQSIACTLRFTSFSFVLQVYMVLVSVSVSCLFCLLPHRRSWTGFETQYGKHLKKRCFTNYVKYKS